METLRDQLLGGSFATVQDDEGDRVDRPNDRDTENDTDVRQGSEPTRRKCNYHDQR